MDLVRLKIELSDPKYAALSDEACANALNAPGPSIDRDFIDGAELAAAITLADYAALQPVPRAYFEMLSRSGFMPLNGGLKKELRQLFPDGDTKKTIAALLRRVGSRAEELGLGRVTPSDVANSRRL